MVKLYIVKNITKDVRRFRDKNTGRDVLVQPMKSVETRCKLESSGAWKVREKVEIKKKKKKKVKKVEKEEVDYTEKTEEELNFKEVKKWQQ